MLLLVGSYDSDGFFPVDGQILQTRSFWSPQIFDVNFHKLLKFSAYIYKMGGNHPLKALTSNLFLMFLSYENIQCVKVFDVRRF